MSRALAFAIALAAVSLALPVPLVACADHRAAGGAHADRRLALARAPRDHAASALVASRQEWARLMPGEADEWVALGRAWLLLEQETHDHGFARSARSCARIAAALAPDAPAPAALEASVLLHEHRFAEALAAADDVLRRVPDDAAALAVACDAACELGRIDEAVDRAQRLADVRPGLAADVRIAWLRWLTGDVAGSLASFASARDAGSPRDPEPLAWCLAQEAQVRFGAGDLAGARAAAEEALRVRPGHVAALVALARVELACSDPAAALRALGSADAGQRSAEVAWLLGDARAASGDARGARRAWDEAARRGRLGDRRTLGMFLATKDRDPDAALAALLAESRVRAEPATMDALAWALLRAGRLDEARAASDAARRWGTRDPALLFHAGAIRVAAGDRQAGEELVRAALAIQPAFDLTGATEARELLAAAGRTASR